MPVTSPRKNLNFKIQLLSGNNVVLVECPGFESELFMPQIVKGRITFQNIIPKRRCCDAANMHTNPIIFPRGIRSNVTITPMRNSQEHLMLNRDNTTVNTPLAKSTPTSLTSLRLRAGKENYLSPQMTPEQVRASCPVADIPSTEDLHMLNLSAPRLSQSEMPAFDTGVGYTSHSPTGMGLNLGNVKSRDQIVCDIARKMQMPLRTYSRRKPSNTNTTPTATTNKPKPVSWSPQKKKKVSTKTPNPAMKVVIRTRKLIVDTKKSLGPHDPNKIVESPVTKRKIIKKQVSGKTRKQFEALKTTAFDLITTPLHTNMSGNLQTQFKLACVNKRSTTLPNYAEVAALPPLQVDREVKLLIAKEKRLKKVKTTKVLPMATLLKGKRI
ncbi:uncharacterized protein LOC115627600 [Scaptodrosophila lebanonensis]|uniref:Uncharacterized protein LOC115627600 n=1 Tax=Drosophila lebanonensis TaxID=7225 RepID=A0A6J2TWB1_DROLE|nr:uncharacterized protein LOC115627600 [Scaptodrosophila lebanonensis]